MDISYSSTTATTYIHTIMFLHSTWYFQALLRRTLCSITTHVWFYVFFGKWGSGGCNRGEQLSYVQKSILTWKKIWANSASVWMKIKLKHFPLDRIHKILWLLSPCWSNNKMTKIREMNFFSGPDPRYYKGVICERNYFDRSEITWQQEYHWNIYFWDNIVHTAIIFVHVVSIYVCTYIAHIRKSKQVVWQAVISDRWH